MSYSHIMQLCIYSYLMRYTVLQLHNAYDKRNSYIMRIMRVTLTVTLYIMRYAVLLLQLHNVNSLRIMSVTVTVHIRRVCMCM